MPSLGQSVIEHVISFTYCFFNIDLKLSYRLPVLLFSNEETEILYAFIFFQSYNSEFVYWHESINLSRVN